MHTFLPLFFFPPSARSAPVKFMFQRKGHVLVDLQTTAQGEIDLAVELALAAGADDFDSVESGEDWTRLKASISIHPS